MIRTEADKLQEMDRLKSKFFANITHEFRTPLTLINGLAEQLKRSKQKVIYNKGEQIQLHSRELLQLVNEILDLSKLEGQVISINYQYGNLSRFLGYLTDSLQGAAIAKSMRLHYLPPRQEVWTDYDQERIKLIVSNLVYNAIRYNPEGIDIYLDLSVSIGQLEISVRDTGQGIEEVHLPYLFDRYYQVDPRGGGTGIGLALVKAVVEQMQGTIQVHVSSCLR